MQSMEFHHVRVRPTEQIGSHEHPVWEISYVIKGHGLRQMGSEQEEFKAGEVVMVIPNLPHQWVFDAEDKEVENITVLFTQEWIDRLAVALPELAETARRIKSHTTALRFSGATLRQLQGALTGMIHEDKAGRLVSLLRILTVIAYGSDMESIGRMSSEAEERLRRINIFISCNYNRDISVDVIARHVGMNRSALCTFYRRQTGKTIIEAVNARRFEVATNLLRRQELSIQQVCFSSGFRDVPYFFRLFKRQYGMTPKSYRQNVSNTTP